ncbi:hypothetical protein SLA2020_112570 [Shorea laevis]
MAFHYKLEADVEIKPTAEQFYRTFRRRAHQVSNVAPTRIQKVTVHQGVWETHGSVKVWNLTALGVAETFKEKVELDEESKTVRLVGLEGDLFNHYKSYVVTLKVIPKGQGGVVKLTIELEKLKEDAADGYKYLDFGIGEILTLILLRHEGRWISVINAKFLI